MAENKEKIKKEAEKAEEKKEEVAEAAEAAEKTEAEQMKASTEAKRRKKAERREAKAVRKEANRVEEKKKRPSNVLLSVLIFGVLIGMFAFIWGYNYYQKEKSIETYLKSSGYAEMYNNVPFDEQSTMKMAADENTLKMVLVVNDDVTGDDLEKYKSGETWEYLQEMGAYMLTTMKPEVRGLSAEVKVGVKQGEEMIAYKKMSYRQAKKYLKEAEEKAETDSETESAE